MRSQACRPVRLRVTPVLSSVTGSVMRHLDSGLEELPRRRRGAGVGVAPLALGVRGEDVPVVGEHLPAGPWTQHVSTRAAPACLWRLQCVCDRWPGEGVRAHSEVGRSRWRVCRFSMSRLLPVSPDLVAPRPSSDNDSRASSVATALSSGRALVGSGLRTGELHKFRDVADVIYSTHWDVGEGTGSRGKVCSPCAGSLAGSAVQLQILQTCLQGLHEAIIGSDLGSRVPVAHKHAT